MSENGTPLSRAKAKSWREFVAMTATHPKILIKSIRTVKTVAPGTDPVVLTNTWMNGTRPSQHLASQLGERCLPPRGVMRTDIVSVTQKQKVMPITHPNNPLPSHVHIIARGITYAASRTSSAMCAPASIPTKQLAAPINPTIAESGVLPHSMLSWKSVKTSLAGALSAITQRGTITAKKPATCRITMSPSTSGSFRDKKVLKTQQMASTAQISSVPCHGFGA